MDFTPLYLPQQQTDVTLVNICNSNTAPVVRESQQLSTNTKRNVPFVCVNWRYSFDASVDQAKPKSHLGSYIERTRIQVVLNDIHVSLQCSRGLLITVDGSFYGPQDPDGFYFWKQSGKGYF